MTRVMPVKKLPGTALLPILSLLLLLSMSAIADDHIDSGNPPDKVSFYKEIRPIFQAN